MRATPPWSNQCGSKTPSTPTKKKKKTHIPLIIQNMDDLEIGGQLTIPIIPLSTGRSNDEDDPGDRPTNERHQARTD